MAWQDAARRAARKYGLPERYFINQMGQEAHGQDLTSPAGAQGPAQIMPATARAWGLNPAQVHDVDASYNAAAKHMSEYVHQFGSFRNALVAYNAGPGRVGGSLPAETQNYIATIMQGNPGHISDTAGQLPSLSDQVAPIGGQQQQQNPIDLISDLTSGGQQDNPYGQILQRGWKLLSQAWDQQHPQQSNIISSIHGSDTGAPQPAEDPGNLPSGTSKFEGTTVAAWIAPALEYARNHGWKGSVNSGFRTLADQTRIWNSGVRPAARPGTSNHEGSEFPRGAVDVSDAEQLSEILRRSRYANLLIWAGSRDPVHFSHPHNGGY